MGDATPELAKLGETALEETGAADDATAPAEATVGKAADEEEDPATSAGLKAEVIGATDETLPTSMVLPSFEANLPCIVPSADAAQS